MLLYQLFITYFPQKFHYVLCTYLYGCLVGFYGISTFEGYLMSNPFLNK